MKIAQIAFIIYVLLAVHSHAQQFEVKIIPDTDTITLCTGQIQPITYTFNGPDISTAPAYTFDSIPFHMESTLGIQVNLGDDANSLALPIGFPFNFWGTIYNSFYIHSNGYISFQSGVPNAITPNPLPNNIYSSFPIIFAAFSDLNPSFGTSSNISFKTIGAAPERRLIVSWDNVPLFFCTEQRATFQIILHETTNIIDIHILNKPVCTSWVDVLGLQALNFNGHFLGYQERNGTVWYAQNSSVRFTPNAFPHQINWFINGVPAGSNPTINAFLTPANPEREYVLKLTEGMSHQNYFDTLHVMPGNESLSILTSPSFVCNQDSSIAVTYTGTNYFNSPLIWDFDGASIQNGTNGEGPGPHVLKWNEFGQKTITLIKDNPNACAANTAQRFVGYTHILPPSINFDASENRIFTSPDYLSYTWFRNNEAIANSNNWFITPVQSGQYFVSATGLYNCTEISDDLFVDITGINKLSNTLIVYPNPASRTLHFASEVEIQSIRIFDAQGREVLLPTKITDSWDVSALLEGVYHICILLSDKKSINKRIVISR
jgi:hypothetical protein